MDALNAWHEAPIYSARERAALAWTEAVTKISDHHVPDEVYDEARHHFSEKELVDLTAAVIAINAWNRVAIASLEERETRSLMDRRNCLGAIRKLVPRRGFEPPTHALRMRCSTG